MSWPLVLQSCSNDALSDSNRNYRVTLRMSDGSTQVITQSAVPGFQAGDKVRLSNGVVVKP